MGESRKQSAASSPCAACKLLRRRCARDCVFAPYFPAEEPHKFASVHKVFGASNVNKMLQELGEEQRGDAVSSMVYEANARVRDPVYGCVGAISSLQKQVDILQTQLALAQAEVVQLRLKQFSSNNNSHDYHNNHNHNHNTSSSPSSRNDYHINHNHNHNTSSSPSSRDDTPPLFNMGMVVDQVNMGESLWSC